MRIDGSTSGAFPGTAAPGGVQPNPRDTSAAAATAPTDPPPVVTLARLAESGSPVSRGEALRALDAATGDRARTDALVAARPDDSERPADMCTVEVRYKRVIGPTHHAFIVTTDSDSVNYFRGGPAGNGFGSGSSGSGASSASSGTSGGADAMRGWGPIVTRYGPYQPGTIDWTTRPTGQQTVRQTAGSCDAIEGVFAAEADRIEAARIPYSPFGPNSNTTVRTLLEAAGITDVTPVVWAPGWNHAMPAR